MSDAEDNKARNREIAENESERQTASDVRVSVWAIAAAVVIGLAAVGWVLLHNSYYNSDLTGFILRDASLRDAPQGEVCNPHGEEREARLEP